MGIRYLDNEPVAPKTSSKIRYLDEVPSGGGGGAELASGIGSLVSPPSIEAPKQGMLQRLLQASKEAVLAPIAPFIPSLRKKALSPVAGQYGFSKVLEDAGNSVGSAIRSAGHQGAEDIASSKLTQANPYTRAYGAGLGTLVSMGSDVAADSLKPSSIQRDLGAQALGEIVINPALKAIASKIEEPAVGMARRSLGFQKSQLSSSKSPFETMRKTAQANRAAETMLDRGGIPMSGSANTMQDNAVKLLAEGRTKVNSAIDGVQKIGTKVAEADIDDALLKGLDPANQAELNTALAIRKDVTDRLTKGQMDIKDLNELRSAWGKSGFQDKTVGSEAANMYRSAWKVASERIKGLVDDLSPRAGEAYRAGLKQEETAMTAMRGIQNRIAGEQGNNLFSIPALTTGLQKRAFAPIANVLKMTSQAVGEAGKMGGAFSQIISRAKARLNEQGKDIKPVETGGGEKVNGSTLSDFVRKAKVGTKFNYQGKTFKVVPQPGRNKNDLAMLSDEQRRTYASSKSRSRGANTFTRA